MDKLSCLKAFVAVVKEGGFSSAARKMGVSKVIVSRQVAQLESSLGVRLLQRSTRKVSPTQSGLTYFENCLPLLAEFDYLDDSIQKDHHAAKGIVKIAAPSSSFTQTHLTPALHHYAKQHPDIELKVELTDRYIDLIEDGFDMAIRIGSLPDSSLIAKKLANMEVILCASPDYLAEFGTPTDPNDLKDHQLVIDSNYRGGKNWVFTRDNDNIIINTSGPITVNCAAVTTDLISRGAGIGLSPSFMVEKSLDNGDIVQILPQWTVYTGGVYAVYTNRKHLSNRIKVFVDILQEYFQSTSLK